jgi:methionyl-tRNA formyltransferase
VIAPIPEFPRRLAYLGSPEMAVDPLRALVAEGFDVAHVVTRIDKRRGRGAELSPTPVKAAALALGLPVSHAVDDLLQLQPAVDLAIVVAFGQLIKPHVLDRIPMVNIHFSLLPRWRGAAPVERALLAGDRVTGTCLMQLEEGLDTGAVFDRVELPIRPTATAAELRRELVALGTEQLIRCLRVGLRGATAQDGEATYAAKLSAADFEIDWQQPIDSVDRLIRIGGAWTTFRGRRLKVHEARLIDERLELINVQPEGRPAMTYRDWANGARPQPGELGG